MQIDLDLAAVTSSSSSLSVSEDVGSLEPGSALTTRRRHHGKRKDKGKSSRGLKSASSINLEAVAAAAEAPVGLARIKNVAEADSDTAAIVAKLRGDHGKRGTVEENTQQQTNNSTFGLENVGIKEIDSGVAKESGTQEKELNNATVLPDTSNDVPATVPQPLRVNLKDFATRKKRSSNTSDMKYVVHRKDWKKWMQSHQGPGSRGGKPAAGGLPEGLTARPAKRRALDLRLARKNESMMDTSTVSVSGSASSRRVFTSASNTQQRLERRHSHRNLAEAARTDGGIAARPEAGPRRQGGAMERYLMFLNRTSRMRQGSDTSGGPDRPSLQRPPSASTLESRVMEQPGQEQEDGGGQAMAYHGFSLPTTPLPPRRKKELPKHALKALLKHAQEMDQRPRLALAGLARDGAGAREQFLNKQESLITPSTGSFTSNINTASTAELVKKTDKTLAKFGEPTAGKSNSGSPTGRTMAGESRLAHMTEMGPRFQHPGRTHQAMSKLNQTKTGSERNASRWGGSQSMFPKPEPKERGKGSPEPPVGRLRSTSGRRNEQATTGNQQLFRSISPWMRSGSNPVLGSRSRSSPASMRHTANLETDATQSAGTMAYTDGPRDDQVRQDIQTVGGYGQRRLTTPDLTLSERRNSTGQFMPQSGRQNSPLSGRREMPRKTTNPASRQPPSWQSPKAIRREFLPRDPPGNKEASRATDNPASNVVGQLGISETTGQERRCNLQLTTNTFGVTESTPEIEGVPLWKAAAALNSSSTELTNIEPVLRRFSTLDMSRMLRTDSWLTPHRSDGHLSQNSETDVPTAGLMPRGLGRRLLAPEGSQTHNQLRSRLEGNSLRSNSNIPGSTGSSGPSRSMSIHVGPWQRATMANFRTTRGTNEAHSRQPVGPRPTGTSMTGHTRQHHHHQKQTTEGEMSDIQHELTSSYLQPLQSTTSGTMVDARSSLTSEPNTMFTAFSRSSRVSMDGRRVASNLGAKNYPPQHHHYQQQQQQIQQQQKDHQQQQQLQLQHQQRLQQQQQQKAGSGSSSNSKKPPEVTISSTSVLGRDRSRRAQLTLGQAELRERRLRQPARGDTMMESTSPTTTPIPARRKTFASSSRVDHTRRKAVASTATSATSGAALEATSTVRTCSSSHVVSSLSDNDRAGEDPLSKERLSADPPRAVSIDIPITDGLLRDSPAKFISGDAPVRKDDQRTVKPDSHGDQEAERKDDETDSDVDDKPVCHFGSCGLVDPDVQPATAEAATGGDKKDSTTPELSPLKRKRKLADRAKKMRKKKRKKREDEATPQDDQRDHSPPQKTTPILIEKPMMKVKGKEKQAKILEGEPKVLEKEVSFQRDPSPQYKGMKKPKEISFVESVVGSKKASPETPRSVSAGHKPIIVSKRSRSRTPPRAQRTIKLPKYRPVRRPMTQPTPTLPTFSHIPVRVGSPKFGLSRTRNDLLIQYRRWKEGMVDPDRPSKIPLSLSFRWTLDSAVVEEWALHCWEPDAGVFMDEQGAWWSSVPDTTPDANSQPSLFTDSALATTTTACLDHEFKFLTTSTRPDRHPKSLATAIYPHYRDLSECDQKDHVNLTTAHTMSCARLSYRSVTVSVSTFVLSSYHQGRIGYLNAEALLPFCMCNLTSLSKIQRHAIGYEEAEPLIHMDTILYLNRNNNSSHGSGTFQYDDRNYHHAHQQGSQRLRHSSSLETTPSSRLCRGRITKRSDRKRSMRGLDLSDTGSGSEARTAVLAIFSLMDLAVADCSSFVTSQASTPSVSGETRAEGFGKLRRGRNNNSRPHRGLHDPHATHRLDDGRRPSGAQVDPSVTFSSYTRQRAGHRTPSSTNHGEDQGQAGATTSYLAVPCPRADAESADTGLDALHSRRTRRNSRPRPWKHPIAQADVIRSVGSARRGDSVPQRSSQRARHGREEEEMTSVAAATQIQSGQTHKSKNVPDPQCSLHSYLNTSHNDASRNFDCFDNNLSTSKCDLERPYDVASKYKEETLIEDNQFTTGIRTETVFSPQSKEAMRKFAYTSSRERPTNSAQNLDVDSTKTMRPKSHKIDPYPHVKAKVQCRLRPRGEFDSTKYSRVGCGGMRRLTELSDCGWTETLERVRRANPRLTWEGQARHFQAHITRKVEEVVMKKAQAIVKSYQVFLEKQANQLKQSAQEEKPSAAGQDVRTGGADIESCWERPDQADDVRFTWRDANSLQDSATLCKDMSEPSELPAPANFKYDECQGETTWPGLGHNECEMQRSDLSLQGGPCVSYWDRTCESRPLQIHSLSGGTVSPEASIKTAPTQEILDFSQGNNGASAVNQISDFSDAKQAHIYEKKEAYREVKQEEAGVFGVCPDVEKERILITKRNISNTTRNKVKCDTRYRNCHARRSGLLRKLKPSKIPVFQRNKQAIRDESWIPQMSAPDHDGDVQDYKTPREDKSTGIIDLQTLSHERQSESPDELSQNVRETMPLKGMAHKHRDLLLTSTKRRFQTPVASTYSISTEPKLQPPRPQHDDPQLTPWWRRSEPLARKEHQANSETVLNVSPNRAFSSYSKATMASAKSPAEHRGLSKGRYRATETRQIPSQSKQDATRTRHCKAREGDQFFSPFVESKMNFHPTTKSGVKRESKWEQVGKNSKAVRCAKLGTVKVAPGGQPNNTDSAKQGQCVPSQHDQRYPVPIENAHNTSTSSSWFSGTNSTDKEADLSGRSARISAMLYSSATDQRHDRDHVIDAASGHAFIKFHFEDLSTGYVARHQLGNLLFVDDSKQREETPTVDNYTESAEYSSSLSTMRSISDLPFNNLSPTGPQEEASIVQPSCSTDGPRHGSPTATGGAGRHSSPGERHCLVDPVSPTTPTSREREWKRESQLFSVRERRFHERRTGAGGHQYRDVNCSNKALCRTSMSEPNLSIESERPALPQVRRCLSSVTVAASSSYNSAVTCYFTDKSEYDKPRIEVDADKIVQTHASTRPDRKTRSVFTRLDAGDKTKKSKAISGKPCGHSLSSMSGFRSDLESVPHHMKPLNTCHSNSPLRKSSNKRVATFADGWYDGQHAAELSAYGPAFPGVALPRSRIPRKQGLKPASRKALRWRVRPREGAPVIQRHDTNSVDSPSSNHSFPSLLQFWEKKASTIQRKRKHNVSAFPTKESYIRPQRLSTPITLKVKQLKQPDYFFRHLNYRTLPRSPCPQEDLRLKTNIRGGLRHSRYPLQPYGTTSPRMQQKENLVGNSSTCAAASFLNIGKPFSPLEEKRGVMAQIFNKKKPAYTILDRRVTRRHRHRILPTRRFICGRNPKTISAYHTPQAGSESAADYHGWSSPTSSCTLYHSAASMKRAGSVHSKKQVQEANLLRYSESSVDAFRRQRVLDFVNTSCNSQKLDTPYILGRHTRRRSKDVDKRYSSGWNTHGKECSDTPNTRTTYNTVFTFDKDGKRNVSRPNKNENKEKLSGGPALEKRPDWEKCKLCVNGDQRNHRQKQTGTRFRRKVYRPHLQVGISPTKAIPSPAFSYCKEEINHSRECTNTSSVQPCTATNENPVDDLQFCQTVIYKQDILEPESFTCTSRDQSSSSPASILSGATGYVISTGLDCTSGSSALSTPKNLPGRIGLQLRYTLTQPNTQRINDTEITTPRTRFFDNDAENDARSRTRQRNSNLTFVRRPREMTTSHNQNPSMHVAQCNSNLKGRVGAPDTVTLSRKAPQNAQLVTQSRAASIVLSQSVSPILNRGTSSGSEGTQGTPHPWSRLQAGRKGTTDSAESSVASTPGDQDTRSPSTSRKASTLGWSSEHLSSGRLVSPSPSPAINSAHASPTSASHTSLTPQDHGLHHKSKGACASSEHNTQSSESSSQTFLNHAGHNCQVPVERSDDTDAFSCCSSRTFSLPERPGTRRERCAYADTSNNDLMDQTHMVDETLTSDPNSKLGVSITRSFHTTETTATQTFTLEASSELSTTKELSVSEVGETSLRHGAHSLLYRPLKETTEETDLHLQNTNQKHAKSVAFAANAGHPESFSKTLQIKKRHEKQAWARRGKAKSFFGEEARKENRGAWRRETDRNPHGESMDSVSHWQMPIELHLSSCYRGIGRSSSDTDLSLMTKMYTAESFRPQDCISARVHQGTIIAKQNVGKDESNAVINALPDHNSDRSGATSEDKYVDPFVTCRSSQTLLPDITNESTLAASLEWATAEGHKLTDVNRVSGAGCGEDDVTIQNQTTVGLDLSQAGEDELKLDNVCRTAMGHAATTTKTTGSLSETNLSSILTDRQRLGWRAKPSCLLSQLHKSRGQSTPPRISTSAKISEAASFKSLVSNSKAAAGSTTQQPIRAIGSDSGSGRSKRKIFADGEKQTEAGDTDKTDLPSSLAARDIEIVLGDDVTVQEFMKCFMGGLDLQVNNSGLSVPSSGRASDRTLSQESRTRRKVASAVNHSKNHVTSDSAKEGKPASDASKGSVQKAINRSDYDKKTNKHDRRWTNGSKPPKSSVARGTITPDGQEANIDVEKTVDMIVVDILKKKLLSALQTKSNKKHDKKTRKEVHAMTGGAASRKSTSPTSKQPPSANIHKSPQRRRSRRKRQSEGKIGDVPYNAERAWWERSVPGKTSVMLLRTPVRDATSPSRKQRPQAVTTLGSGDVGLYNDGKGKRKRSKQGKRTTNSPKPPCPVIWSSSSPHKAVSNRGSKSKAEDGRQRSPTTRSSKKTTEKSPRPALPKDLSQRIGRNDILLSLGELCNTNTAAKKVAHLRETPTSSSIGSHEPDCSPKRSYKNATVYEVNTSGKGGSSSDDKLWPRRSYRMMNLYQTSIFRHARSKPRDGKKKKVLGQTSAANADRGYRRGSPNSIGSPVCESKPPVHTKSDKKSSPGKQKKRVTKRATPRMKHKSLSQALMELESKTAGGTATTSGAGTVNSPSRAGGTPCTRSHARKKSGHMANVHMGSTGDIKPCTSYTGDVVCKVKHEGDTGHNTAYTRDKGQHTAYTGRANHYKINPGDSGRCVTSTGDISCCVTDTRHIGHGVTHTGDVGQYTAYTGSINRYVTNSGDKGQVTAIAGDIGRNLIHPEDVRLHTASMGQLSGNTGITENVMVHMTNMGEMRSHRLNTEVVGLPMTNVGYIRPNVENTADIRLGSVITEDLGCTAKNVTNMRLQTAKERDTCVPTARLGDIRLYPANWGDTSSYQTNLGDTMFYTEDVSDTSLHTTNVRDTSLHTVHEEDAKLYSANLRDISLHLENLEDTRAYTANVEDTKFHKPSAKPMRQCAKDDAKNLTQCPVNMARRDRDWHEGTEPAADVKLGGPDYYQQHLLHYCAWDPEGEQERCYCSKKCHYLGPSTPDQAIKISKRGIGDKLPTAKTIERDHDGTVCRDRHECGQLDVNDTRAKTLDNTRSISSNSVVEGHEMSPPSLSKTEDVCEKVCKRCRMKDGLRTCSGTRNRGCRHAIEVGNSLIEATKHREYQERTPTGVRRSKKRRGDKKERVGAGAQRATAEVAKSERRKATFNTAQCQCGAHQQEQRMQIWDCNRGRDEAKLLGQTATTQENSSHDNSEKQDTTRRELATTPRHHRHNQTESPKRHRFSVYGLMATSPREENDGHADDLASKTLCVREGEDSSSQRITLASDMVELECKDGPCETTKGTTSSGGHVVSSRERQRHVHHGDCVRHGAAPGGMPRTQGAIPAREKAESSSCWQLTPEWDTLTHSHGSHGDASMEAQTPDQYGGRFKSDLDRMAPDGMLLDENSVHTTREKKTSTKSQEKEATGPQCLSVAGPPERIVRDMPIRPRRRCDGPVPMPRPRTSVVSAGHTEHAAHRDSAVQTLEPGQWRSTRRCEPQAQPSRVKTGPCLAGGEEHTSKPLSEYGEDSVDVADLNQKLLATSRSTSSVDMKGSSVDNPSPVVEDTCTNIDDMVMSLILGRPQVKSRNRDKPTPRKRAALKRRAGDSKRDSFFDIRSKDLEEENNISYSDLKNVIDKAVKENIDEYMQRMKDEAKPASVCVSQQMPPQSSVCSEESSRRLLLLGFSPPTTSSDSISKTTSKVPLSKSAFTKRKQSVQDNPSTSISRQLRVNVSPSASCNIETCVAQTNGTGGYASPVHTVQLAETIENYLSPRGSPISREKVPSLPELGTEAGTIEEVVPESLGCPCPSPGLRFVGPCSFYSSEVNAFLVPRTDVDGGHNVLLYLPQECGQPDAQVLVEPPVPMRSCSPRVLTENGYVHVMFGDTTWNGNKVDAVPQELPSKPSCEKNCQTQTLALQQADRVVQTDIPAERSSMHPDHALTSAPHASDLCHDGPARHSRTHAPAQAPEAWGRESSAFTRYNRSVDDTATRRISEDRVYSHNLLEMCTSLILGDMYQRRRSDQLVAQHWSRRRHSQGHRDNRNGRRASCDSRHPKASRQTHKDKDRVSKAEPVSSSSCPSKGSSEIDRSNSLEDPTRSESESVNQSSLDADTEVSSVFDNRSTTTNTHSTSQKTTETMNSKDQSKLSNSDEYTISKDCSESGEDCSPETSLSSTRAHLSSNREISTSKSTSPSLSTKSTQTFEAERREEKHNGEFHTRPPHPVKPLEKRYNVTERRQQGFPARFHPNTDRVKAEREYGRSENYHPMHEKRTLNRDNSAPTDRRNVSSIEQTDGNRYRASVKDRVKTHTFNQFSVYESKEPTRPFLRASDFPMSSVTDREGFNDGNIAKRNRPQITTDYQRRQISNPEAGNNRYQTNESRVDTQDVSANLSTSNKGSSPTAQVENVGLLIPRRKPIRSDHFKKATGRENKMKYKYVVKSSDDEIYVQRQRREARSAGGCHIASSSSREGKNVRVDLKESASTIGPGTNIVDYARQNRPRSGYHADNVTILPREQERSLKNSRLIGFSSPHNDKPTGQAKNRLAPSTQARQSMGSPLKSREGQGRNASHSVDEDGETFMPSDTYLPLANRWSHNSPGQAATGPVREASGDGPDAANARERRLPSTSPIQRRQRQRIQRNNSLESRQSSDWVKSEESHTQNSQLQQQQQQQQHQQQKRQHQEYQLEKPHRQDQQAQYPIRQLQQQHQQQRQPPLPHRGQEQRHLEGERQSPQHVNMPVQTSTPSTASVHHHRLTRTSNVGNQSPGRILIRSGQLQPQPGKTASNLEESPAKRQPRVRFSDRVTEFCGGTKMNQSQPSNSARDTDVQRDHILDTRTHQSPAYQTLSVGFVCEGNQWPQQPSGSECDAVDAGWSGVNEAQRLNSQQPSPGAACFPPSCGGAGDMHASSLPSSAPRLIGKAPLSVITAEKPDSGYSTPTQPDHRSSLEEPRVTAWDRAIQKKLSKRLKRFT